MGKAEGKPVEKRRKESLSVKLIITTIIMFTLVTLGVLQISYQLHRARTDAIFFEWAATAAKKTAETEDAQLIRHFLDCIDTEEFRQLHQEAIETGDESILLDWMQQKPSFMMESAEEIDYSAEELKEIEEIFTLLFDYGMMGSALNPAQNEGAISYVALEYAKDGKVYYLTDASSSAILIGEQDTEVPEEARQGVNRSIPPTLYRSRENDAGWLCTAYEPIVDEETGEVVAMISVDVDMNRIVAERRLFLRNIALMMIGFALICVLLNILVVHRIAANPLKRLTDATCGFADGKETLSKDDVIEVDIRSRDEIYDLYQEIRKMQTRIVDYTDHMAKMTAEKERYNTEMRLAEGIQSAMLPSSFPERSDFDLYASMTPAKEVGGDFYDFFLADDDHLVLTIADVSGKGVPGALFMMAVMIQLKDRVAAGGSAAAILSAVNNQICSNNQVEMFVTVWLGILDLRTGIMDCANAGHEYPMIRETDGLYRLLKDKHGLPLGAMENVSYNGYELTLEPGNAVFVYTDGIPEATDRNDAFYGTDRLLNTLNEEPSRTPEETLKAVRCSVDAFTDGAERFDDLTMMCLNYKGSGKGDRKQKQEEPDDELSGTVC